MSGFLISFDVPSITPVKPPAPFFPLTMNKVSPIGGTHRSPQSFFAEFMNDEDIEHCVVVAILKNGKSRIGKFDISRAELAFAALLIQHEALDD